MAKNPTSELVFPSHFSNVHCGPCGERITTMPELLPEIGDDFVWRVRDFSQFRQFMLEELAARFPDRKRWTTADIEVVIVEVLSASLDSLSDMADRVFAEGYLQTARRPDSLRRLLALISYDAVAQADALDQIDIDHVTDLDVANDLLDQYWADHPDAMEKARKAGPKSIRSQHRMVSSSDMVAQLSKHPLVSSVKTSQEWTGSWFTQYLTILPSSAFLELDNDLDLDTLFTLSEVSTDSPEQAKIRVKLDSSLKVFNELCRLPVHKWNESGTPKYSTARQILSRFVNLYRLVGQEFILLNAVQVGLTIGLNINIKSGHFQSEIKLEVQRRLTSRPGGFFESGKFGFGQDVFASDVIAELMHIPGVENICLVSFKRTGSQFRDQRHDGRIELSGSEVAVCENDPLQPELGYITLKFNGGSGQ